MSAAAARPQAAWAEAGRLIGTKAPARTDEAVTLLAELRELARREGQAGDFERRFAVLREQQLGKPSLVARFDRAGLTGRTGS